MLLSFTNRLIDANQRKVSLSGGASGTTTMAGRKGGTTGRDEEEGEDVDEYIIPDYSKGGRKPTGGYHLLTDPDPEGGGDGLGLSVGSTDGFFTSSSSSSSSRNRRNSGRTPNRAWRCCILV